MNHGVCEIKKKKTLYKHVVQCTVSHFDELETGDHTRYRNSSEISTVCDLLVGTSAVALSCLCHHTGRQIAKLL